MEHYARSIIPVIEYNYENFTSLERTIADFFIQNKKKQDFSAKAVSERLFVSEASLSRFAKKCGFRGYRNLSISMRIHSGRRRAVPLPIIREGCWTLTRSS